MDIVSVSLPVPTQHAGTLKSHPSPLIVGASGKFAGLMMQTRLEDLLGAGGVEKSAMTKASSRATTTPTTGPAVRGPSVFSQRHSLLSHRHVADTFLSRHI